MTTRQSTSLFFREQYQWACRCIKPGDRVLHVGQNASGEFIREESNAASVFHLDDSTDSFSDVLNNSFEMIVFFGVFKNHKNFIEYLKAFHCMLTPGGRVVIRFSLENKQFDYSVFNDWNTLNSLLFEAFIFEEAATQSIEEHTDLCHNLKSISLNSLLSQEEKWLFVTVMKSPLNATLPYEERVLPDLAKTRHPSVCYADFFINPWIMYSIVNISYRLKNPTALESLAEDLLNSMPVSSNDYGAALCVKAYQIIGQLAERELDARNIIEKINQFVSVPYSDPMGLRWTVSLLSIQGKLWQALGESENAKQAFLSCAAIDVRPFGIHLSTKTTDAIYWVGRIAYEQGNSDEAYTYWRRGVEDARLLLDISLEDITINSDFPNRFNFGDGIREYTLAWDNIARCANGVHLLKLNKPFTLTQLDNCHATEYSTVTHHLIEARQLLIERTHILEKMIHEQKEKDHKTEKVDLVRTVLEYVMKGFNLLICKVKSLGSTKP